jgi:hypothetical protein
MQMVSAAFSHLSDKLRAGEVAAEVVQKLSQLVSDLANRNFTGASSIQTVCSLPLPLLSPSPVYLCLSCLPLLSTSTVSLSSFLLLYFTYG